MIEENKSLTVDEMSPTEVIELAVSLGLGKKPALKKLSQEELIAKVKEWEASHSQDGNVTNTVGEVTASTEEYHEGKLVIGHAEREVNGIAYDEITVEGGVTHLVRKQ